MDMMHRIEGVIILDSEGKRIYSKYYGEAWEGRLDRQAKFESTLYSKTKSGPMETPKEGGDITIVESHTVVFRLDPEVYFYVIGSLDENEIVISNALCIVYESLSGLLRSPVSVEKRQLLENFDLLVLVIDETFHDGLMLQSNSSDVLALVFDHATESHDAVSKIKTVLKTHKNSMNL